MANETIREEAKKQGVYLWEVAETLGLRDNQLSIKLRHELSPAESDRIISIIRKLGGAKSNV